MSDLGDLLHSTQEETSIYGTIKDVDVFATFHTGFIDLDFYYEQVELQLEIETEFETVYLEAPVDNFFESPFSEVLMDVFVINDENALDLNALKGKSVHLAFDEEYNRASIGITNDVEYDPESHLIKRQLSSDTTTVEKRSIEYGNKKLKDDLHILSNGVDGWVQAEFSFVGEIENKYLFKAVLDSGREIYWDFESEIDSTGKIKDFLRTLGITYTTEELDTEYIWVKPIETVDHTNRRDTKLMLDSEMKWTARKEPQSAGYSIIEKIKRFLTPSESISVTSGKGFGVKANASNSNTSIRDVLEKAEVETETST